MSRLLDAVLFRLEIARSRGEFPLLRRLKEHVAEADPRTTRREVDLLPPTLASLGAEAPMLAAILGSNPRKTRPG